MQTMRKASIGVSSASCSPAALRCTAPSALRVQLPAQRMVLARDGPRVTPGREFREEDGSMTGPGTASAPKEGGPMYADQAQVRLRAGVRDERRQLAGRPVPRGGLNNLNLHLVHGLP